MWGCPVYGLQPRLQDRGKLTKWDHWSRRGQYMGISPLHASTVELILNLNINHMSPQFHGVYGNLFQTFHSDEGKPPAKCPDLIIFDRFCSNFDNSVFFPELADEWLTPIDITRLREAELDHWNQAAYQGGDNPKRAPDDAPSQRAPNQDGTAPQRAPHDVPA